MHLLRILVYVRVYADTLLVPFMHVYTHVARMQKRVIDLIIRTVAYMEQNSTLVDNYMHVAR